MTHALGKRVLTVVGVAATGLAAVGCLGSGRTELATGESVRVSAASVPSSWDRSPQLTAQLPDGALDVGWTPEQGVVADLRDLDDREVIGAEGTTVLAVSVSLDPTSTPVPAPAGFAVDGDAEREVTLLSAGQRTPLPVGDLTAGDVVVAAVADGSDVALEVTFDGVTQVVGPQPDDREVPAPARPLYGALPSDTAAVPCLPEGVGVTCRADVTWLPWVAAGGWAPEGELWPVVRVEGAWSGAGSPVTPQVLLDGEEPIDGQDLGATGAGFNRLVVFPASAARSARLSLAVVGPDDQRVAGEVVLSAGR